MLTCNYLSTDACSSHFVSSCLSEMLGVGLVSGLFLRLGFTLGYCFFLFEEKRVRVLDYSCWLYSSPQAILKLSQSARRQVVTVTESGVSVHLITCIPGYICSCLEHLTWQILSWRRRQGLVACSGKTNCVTEAWIGVIPSANLLQEMNQGLGISSNLSYSVFIIILLLIISTMLWVIISFESTTEALIERADVH